MSLLLVYLVTMAGVFHDPESSALKIVQTKKNAQASLAFFLIVLCTRDHGRIQTCNLLSRNQVRYSVAPHGLLAGANINAFFKL